MNQTPTFRSLHSQPGHPLILANVWDAAGARIAESYGAKAIATTSAGVAWAKGYPDGSSMPPVLQARLAEELVQAVRVPVSIDFENGYSDDPEAVAENLRPLLEAGISGINLEDGSDAPELLARKIESIKQAASSLGADIFINARTDVYLRDLVSDDEKVRETLSRAAIYQSAGADGLFVPVVTEAQDIDAIVKGTQLPLNVMYLPGLPSIEELADLGVRRLSAGSAIAQNVHREFARLTQGFLAQGKLETTGDGAMPYSDLQQLFTREK